MKKIYLLFLLCFSLNAQASTGVSHGHYSVVNLKDCAALDWDESKPGQPAIQYLDNAYKRCMVLSRKHLKEQNDLSDVQETSVQTDEKPVTRAPVNYYRITPVKKEGIE